MLKKLSFGLVIVGLTTEALSAYQMSLPEAFYYYAHQGNMPALQNLKSRRYSVEASDKDGNSALCKSIYAQDYSAFAMLLQIGASTSHPCVNNIPSETIEQFNEEYTKWVKAVDSGKITYAGATTQTTTTTSTATTTSSRTASTTSAVSSTTGATATATTETLATATATTGSMGGSVLSTVPTWAWWAGGAILVAGGAAALAGGGGGGGSSGPQKSGPLIGKEASNNNNGIIELENDQYRDVYGLQGTEERVTVRTGGLYFETKGAFGTVTSPETNETSTSNITITNTSNGDAYGLQGVNSYSVYGALSLGASGYSSRHANNTITINNHGSGNVYGISEAGFIWGAYTNGTSTENFSTNSIILTNEGNGNVYGMYGTKGKESANVYGAYSSGAGSKNTATNIISLTNTGNGNLYGIYADSSVAGACTHGSTENNTVNTITLTNEGNGYVYGIYGGADSSIHGAYGGSRGTTTSTIIQTNTGDGYVYGIYGGADSSIHGAYGFLGDSNSTTTSTIIQTNTGDGYVYGIYGGADSSIHGAYGGSRSTTTSIIIQTNTGSGTTYGIYGTKVDASMDNRSTNTIKITTTGGKAVGIYGGKSITQEVNDTITINYLGGRYTTNTDTIAPETDTTFAAGFYVARDASATNKGDIIIKREAWTDDNGTADTSDDITYTPTGRTGKVCGIYVEGNNTSSKTITNSGTITISGVDNAYGIYVANGTNVTVKNTGTITIDGVSKTNDSTADGKFIVLNGGTLLNASVMSTTSMNTASMGGTLMATTGAKFNIENKMSGPVVLNSEITTQGFNATYVEKDMINAGDTSELKLISGSALFDASLADNGHDVVMSMKSFDEVTDNASFAKFLASNYASANNEAFFNTLKEISSTSALTDALNKMMGKEMLSRFAFEDMTMMRELNFDMNNNLFNMKENHLSVAGSVSSPMAFRGDTGSNSRYTLTSKSDGIWSIGLGVAFTNTRSDDDDNGNTRADSMYQMIVPIGYKAGGFKLMTSPRLGYARGTYDRTGFEERTYDGTIEKRIFGLMNEARYPIALGDWKFEPVTEFNLLGYEQKGHEEAKEYSLYIPTQRAYSVESGIGLYATHETKLDKESTMKFTTGVTAYHEFADPYKMDVGMNGMNGTFTLRDEKRTENRAVARAGFNYDTQTYGISASVISYIDRENRTKANLGFNWKF